jgi:hypothetical protein
MGRRVYSVVLAVLLCVAGVVLVLMVDLLRAASGWADVAVVAGGALIVLLPVYLIVRPPSFGDDSDDGPGGGGKTPTPAPPDSPAPHDGVPVADWASFDDIRRDWDREPAST